MDAGGAARQAVQPGAGPASPGAAGTAVPAARPRPESLVVLANQYAGTLSRLRGQQSLEDFARAAGLDARVVFPRSAGHLRHLLHELVREGVPRVAVAGGDGTIHAAVQELAGTSTALGILPQGTANNFATALRLPRDLPTAFRVLAEGEERSVELGLADGEYFTEGAGVGLFADVLAFTQGGHSARHMLRAMHVVLRSIALSPAQRICLTLDGERREETVMNVTVANSFCVGYNLPIAPQARLTDGILDVVLIGALTRREMLSYFRAIRAQSHAELPKVQVLRAREIRLQGRGPLMLHVDDRIRRREVSEIRVVPEALRVVVDRL